MTIENLCNQNFQVFWRILRNHVKQTRISLFTLKHFIWKQMTIVPNKVIVILNVLKVKYLWKQIQFNLEKRNEIYIKFMIVPTLGFLLKKQKRPSLSKVSFSCKLKLNLNGQNCNLKKRIRDANKLLRQQELERKQLLQQLNQSDTVLRSDNNTLQKVKWFLEHQ